MPVIGPHEYDYLSAPVLSSGDDMVEYTIQHLCFVGALKLGYWKVAVHPHNPHPVVRLFLTRVPIDRPLTKAEETILGFFPTDRPIHLGELRMRMRERDMDAAFFKYDRVGADLRASGLLSWRYWLSGEGRRARGEVRRAMEAFTRELEDPNTRPELLQARLSDVGGNVVLYSDDLRDELRKLKGYTPDLSAVFAIGSFLRTDGVYMNPRTLGSFSYGGGASGGWSGGGGGGGGFGGFGGGGFGGGGAGGSW